MRRISMMRFLWPILLAVLTAGQVWAQSGSYRHSSTIYDDSRGLNLRGPAGVDCAGDRIVVADSRNSRLLFYVSEKETEVLVKEVKLARQIRPTIVQIGSGEDLLVYDSRAKELLRFGPDGKGLGKVEPGNVPSGSRIIPKSFRVDESGAVYLMDVYGRRVVVLEKTGAYRKQVPFPREFGFFSDLAVDDNGRIYLLDSVRSQVFTAAPEEDTFTPLSGILKDTLAYPTQIEVDSKGLLYIVDEETSTIGVLRRDGSFKGRLFNRGRKEGLLYYPAQICVGDGSRLVIADRDNNRVQVFVEKE